MMEPNARANVIAALITSAQQSGSLDQLLQTGTLQTLFAADAGQSAPPHVPLVLPAPPPASSATQSLAQATQRADDNPRQPTPSASGSRGFELPGWGYIPPTPNTPNRHHHGTLAMRNQLFQPYTSPGPGKKQKKNFVNAPKNFSKKVVALMNHQTEENPQKPNKTDLFDLSSSGVGEKLVDFNTGDDVNAVLHKIMNAFQPYSVIKGGIQMFVQADRGNCSFLVRCKQPLVNGLQLNALSHTKIYVAPLQDERVPVKSGDEDGSFPIVCIDCGQTIDALQLSVHKGVCKEATALLGSENPDGLRLLAALKEEQMNATDEMANDDPALRNAIEVNRNNLVDDAVALSQNEDFLSKLSYPLGVKFVDEPGVDCGAVRSDFLWNLLEKIESTFDAVLSAYRNAPESTEDDEDMLSRRTLSHRLFAYGLFCGIAVLQHGVTSSFMRYAVERVSIAGADQPFLKGFNMQKVADLLLQHSTVRAVFVDAPLTSQLFLENIKFEEPSADLATSMLELGSREHFVSFLKKVESGNIQLPNKNRKLSLSDVLLFCTGNRKFGRNADEPKIQVSFVLSPRRTVFRPESRACFRKLVLPLTSTAEIMETVFVEALASGDAFTLA